MTARRFVVVLAMIAVAAFAGRVVYILTVTQDEATIDQFYFTSAAGDGFRFAPIYGASVQENAERPPLTALVLAPVARLTDGDELAMRFTVALAGVGVVVLIGLVARDVAGARAGLTAAGVAAVYPNLWMNDGLLLAETFAALGTAATVLLVYRMKREPTWTNAAAVGVACAFSMLSRGELVLLVPLLAVPAVLTMKFVALNRRLRLVAVVVLAAAIPVAPWIGYNLSRFDEPVYLSYGDAGVLLGANCDKTYSGERLGFWEGFCTGTSKLSDPSAVAERNRRRAFDYVGDHLGRLPVVVAAREGRMWSVYRPFQMADFSELEGRPKWASLVGLGMYWLLIGLSVGGAIGLRRRGVALLPLLAPVVVVVLIAALFYGLVRFRVPAEVPIVVFAAVAVDDLARRAHWSLVRRGALPLSSTKAL